MNLLQSREREMKSLKNEMASLSLVEVNTQSLKKEMIKDHNLQFLLEPLIAIESRFKYLTIRRNLSQMEVLALVR